MKRMIVNILVVFYVIITIPITILLINYNDYGVTVIGNNTLLVPKKTDLSGYSRNSLLIVKKNLDNIKVGDKIVYYNTYSSDIVIESNKVADIIDNPKTFIVGSSSYHILYNYVIGNQKFLIILPILILFILELYLFVTEVRKKKHEKK